MDQNTLNKLANLANSDSKGNRQAFKTIVIKLGVKPVEHFPKVKGKDGKTQKDENGDDVRSKVSDWYTYTFSEFETSKIVKVVLDKKELKVNTDYTLSYYYYNEKNEKISTAEPKDAAVYFIDVVGKGNYAGKTGSLNYFEIEKYSFNWVEINVSQASKNSTPVVTVKSIDKGFSFVKDKDFTVSDPYVYSGGTKGSVTITSTGKGNLGEGSKQVDYLIVGKSITSCTASFVGDKTVYQYTGNEIIPSIKVYDGSVLLTKGKDYTI